MRIIKALFKGIVIAVGLLGALTGAWAGFSDSLPPLALTIFVGLLGLLSGVVQEYQHEIVDKWNEVDRIRGADEIEKVMLQMIGKAQRILFFGRLDTVTAQALIGRANNQSPRFDEITIRNTNPNFYIEHRDLANALSQVDATYQNFESRFHFYTQFFDLLAVQYSNNRTDVIHRWVGDGGAEQAVRLNNTPWPADHLISDGPIVSCDDPDGGQGDNLKATAQLFEKYCRHVRGDSEGDEDGWSWPLLPDIGDQQCMDLLIAENLRWFDEVGRKLMEGATQQHRIRVTWRIHVNSVDNADKFAQWLRALDSSNITVERYLLIDETMLGNQAYMEVLKTIDERFFSRNGTRAPSPSYIVRYVPAGQLRSFAIPDSDFALFELAKGIWAQGALHTRNGQWKFIRVWFCRSRGTVEKYKKLFDGLSRVKQFEKLSTLMQAYTKP